MNDAVSRDIDEALQAYEDLQKRLAKEYAAYGPWWRRSFLTSVYTGVGAVLVLVSGAIAKAGPAFWTLAWWAEILNVAP